MNHHSTLTERLRTPAEAGLYALPPGGRAAIEACANALGFAVLNADLAGCGGKADFLERIASALRFPDWFGRNWDALADCLADMSWLPADGYVIILEHADDLRAGAAAQFDTALSVLDQAVHDQAAHGVPMWVFVDAGDHSPAGLRSL